jgi:serine/threonine protein phosphatase PrpC
VDQVTEWRSSAATPEACASCGGTRFDRDNFCENCGTRRPAAPPHTDLNLGVIAGVSDIGKRHHNNEDAFAIALGDRYAAAVVCDGVSSSSRPDTASNAAVTAAIRSLISTLDELTDADVSSANAHQAVVEEAMVTAVGAAQAAATLSAGVDVGPNPPSTTLVSAIVTAAAVTIGWVGDSRAYWIPDSGDMANAAVLTVDDTLAGQLAAAGVTVADDAPSAGALLRWLGADANDTTPHLNTVVPEGPGRVLVCSDGLYRYVPEPSEIGRVTHAGTAIDVAAALVSFAVTSGGHDNVTVVVMPTDTHSP